MGEDIDIHETRTQMKEIFKRKFLFKHIITHDNKQVNQSKWRTGSSNRVPTNITNSIRCDEQHRHFSKKL
jgi:hypothetical protein